MKHISLIQGIVEFIAGLCLILRPNILFWNSSFSALEYNLSKMYGIIAMAFGVLCLIIYRHSESLKLIKLSALVCIGLNIFLGFHLWGLFQSNIIFEIAPCIFHIGLGIIQFLIYLRKI